MRIVGVLCVLLMALAMNAFAQSQVSLAWDYDVAAGPPIADLQEYIFQSASTDSGPWTELTRFPAVVNNVVVLTQTITTNLPTCLRLAITSMSGGGGGSSWVQVAAGILPNTNPAMVTFTQQQATGYRIFIDATHDGHSPRFAEFRAFATDPTQFYTDTTATASSERVDGEAFRARDNDLTTRWIAATGPPQWLSMTFASAHTVGGIDTRHVAGNTTGYTSDYRLELQTSTGGGGQLVTSGWSNILCLDAAGNSPPNAPFSLRKP